MKKCLTYMSKSWEVWTVFLILWLIFIPFLKINGYILISFIYTINAMSLSLYGDITTDIHSAGRNGDNRLILTLPMSRKTIYDSRMYFTGGVYLAGLLLCIFPFIKDGLYFNYLISAESLLWGHIICGLCIRKPSLKSIAALPAFILLIQQLACDWFESLEYGFLQIRKNRVVLYVAIIIFIIMFFTDIYVWIRERKIFIAGSPKGNIIKKAKMRKEVKHYGPDRKTLYTLMPFAILASIIPLLFQIAVIAICIIFGAFSTPDVHDNVNDYLKYHTGEQAEEAYRSKWGMDETIWPDMITDNMNVDDYKMVYYDPWDAQFLGYLTVRYDKKDYENEVRRLKDYQSTNYIGYYGVTGFDDYELLAMYADSYQGFVYALTDGKDTIIYVEIIFCNYFMDLDYKKYIPADYLPEGFNAKQGNPYELKKESEL